MTATTVTGHHFLKRKNACDRTSRKPVMAKTGKDKRKIFEDEADQMQEEG